MSEAPTRRPVTQTTPPLSKDDLSVLLQGQRLKITATVDLEGIGKLKEILSKYEEILKLTAN
jgi:hypothetical protein